MRIELKETSQDRREAVILSLVQNGFKVYVTTKETEQLPIYTIHVEEIKGGEDE